MFSISFTMRKKQQQQQKKKKQECLFACLNDVTLPDWVHSLRQEFAPNSGENSFL